MKPLRSLVCLMVALAGVTACTPKPSIPGGASATPPGKREVSDAAAFAVAAEGKGLGQGTRLELVRIVHAEEQVVAGMNYRLVLRVTLDGKSREAEAVVWWQSWRRPDPYQLTSWVWRDR